MNVPAEITDDLRELVPWLRNFAKHVYTSMPDERDCREHLESIVAELSRMIVCELVKEMTFAHFHAHAADPYVDDHPTLRFMSEPDACRNTIIDGLTAANDSGNVVPLIMRPSTDEDLSQPPKAANEVPPGFAAAGTLVAISGGAVSTAANPTIVDTPATDAPVADTPAASDRAWANKTVFGTVAAALLLAFMHPTIVSSGDIRQDELAYPTQNNYPSSTLALSNHQQPNQAAQQQIEYLGGRIRDLRDQVEGLNAEIVVTDQHLAACRGYGGSGGDASTTHGPIPGAPGSPHNTPVSPNPGPGGDADPGSERPQDNRLVMTEARRDSVGAHSVKRVDTDPEGPLPPPASFEVESMGIRNIGSALASETLAPPHENGVHADGQPETSWTTGEYSYEVVRPPIFNIQNETLAILINDRTCVCYSQTSPQPRPDTETKRPVDTKGRTDVPPITPDRPEGADPSAKPGSAPLLAEAAVN
jgi:hypothetical protein